ncbi:tyrosine-type recombinase/integrase [Rhizobium sp. GN54]|uniref:tyrosine-type recombinase/integrase n=1 Tax=Rhizobium sp. GN54 TaxID=2898150 RepID=UPI001E51CD04|nr:site-specific integrase [Rhizobium sp. GN54]MCD2183661.1 site-specific integrase [Rhizobium sp. GN54]
MSLVKRENSKFWYVQFQIDHRTIIRSTRTTDRKAAEQVAVKIRAEVHAEIILGKKEQITLETALRRFANTKTGTANYRNLVSQMRIILAAIDCSVLLVKVTSETLEQFRQARLSQGCGPQTIKHGLNFLMGAIRLARKDGFDCQQVEPPSVRIGNSRVRYLNVEEERRLLRELDPSRETNGLSPEPERRADRQKWMQDNFDLVLMLIDTGARYSEIANIRWKDIDLETGTIRLWRSKVQNESVIFMTDRVVSILQRRLSERDGETVFTNKAGDARGYSAIAIRKAFRRAGLHDCTIHTLRHTHATRLVQNGLTIQEVKSVLGHTDIRTTMRYAHLEQATVTRKARDIFNALNRSIVIGG